MATDRLAELCVRCWTDPNFKARFLQDPKGILLDLGVEVPEDVKKINVVENTPDTAYFVLPAVPDLAEIQKEDLQEFASRILSEQLVLPTILG